MLLASLSGLPLPVLLFITFIFSILVGSFLNVVIYRLPIIMDNEYKDAAREILELEPEKRERFTLSYPRSGCRNCNHQIASFENIPVFSYLFMRGKCRGCKTPISIFYPIVELVTGLLSVWVVWHFGYTYQGLFAILFVWFLVALTGIDLKVQLLPDIITIPFMWIGIMLGFYSVFISLEMAVIGALVGYLSLWTIAKAFYLFTKREGMGLGDAKLLAALCAWIHIQYIPVILLFASVLGILVTILQKLFKKGKVLNTTIPFGPYLSAGGFLALLYGEPILNWYLHTLI